MGINHVGERNDSEDMTFDLVAKDLRSHCNNDVVLGRV